MMLKLVGPGGLFEHGIWPCFPGARPDTDEMVYCYRCKHCLEPEPAAVAEAFWTRGVLLRHLVICPKAPDIVREQAKIEQQEDKRARSPSRDKSPLEVSAQTDMAFALGKLALAFGRVDRVTFHEDGRRPETDTDHTVMLGLVACALCPEHLDRGRVAQLALAHDLVEARCGDTNSYAITPEQAADKRAREEGAFSELHEEFGPESWVIRRIVEYERQEIPEARYVRYLDKAMPKITHLLNRCAAIKAMGHSQEDLERNHANQLAKLDEEYPEMKDTMRPVLEMLMRMSSQAY